MGKVSIKIKYDDSQPFTETTADLKHVNWFHLCRAENPTAFPKDSINLQDIETGSALLELGYIGFWQGNINRENANNIPIRIFLAKTHLEEMLPPGVIRVKDSFIEETETGNFKFFGETRDRQLLIAVALGIVPELPKVLEITPYDLIQIEN